MNPETGTFTSMDTYRGNSYDPASLHRYTYAQNNPQMYNDPSGHFVAVISMAINSVCTQFVRKFDYLNVVATFGGAMSVIANDVLGGEDKVRPEEAFVAGYLGTMGFAFFYSFTMALSIAFQVQALCHAGWAAFFTTQGIIDTAMAIISGATGNDKAAALYATFAVMCFTGALMEMKMAGVAKVTGKKGSVTFGVEGKSGSNPSINNKRLYRVMGEGELEAVKTTGMLRGGREGTTYFTDSYFRNANKAKSRLALPQKPSYIVEFEIRNNPNISGGTKVQPAFGERGGGREYFTDDIIEVFIINYQKMIGGS